jgi:DNA-binding MarR family transcriptional regulator
MAAASAVSTEARLWRDFVVLRQRVDRALEQRLQRDAGISVADFEILTTLCRADDGQLRPGSLGELLGWEKSRLSHQVTRMEARGLVARRDCPTDQRGTWVTITDSGHSAAAAAMAGHAEVLKDSFSALSGEERITFETVVGDLVRGTSGTECTGSGISD